MKHLTKPTLISIFATSITLAIIIVPSVTFAHDGEHTETNNSAGGSSSSTPSPKVSVSSEVTDKKSRAEAEIRDKIEAKTSELQQKASKLDTEAKQKLDDGKHQICEKQQNTINTVMDNMDLRRQKAFDHITKVSDAVQAFYVKKQLHIENYDTLVAAIATAKSTAQANMNSQLSVPKFNCDGDHPRADISDFKQKRSASIDANGAYRDAVKYLIKAVKGSVEKAKL